MDWNEIILTVVSIVVTALVGVITTFLTRWLNSKVTDTDEAKTLTEITKIVSSAVQSVFQTYVQALKESGTFDAEAQKKALNKALSIIDTELNDKMRTYIVEHYGDITDWLTNQIESTIYALKK